MRSTASWRWSPWSGRPRRRPPWPGMTGRWSSCTLAPRTRGGAGRWNGWRWSAASWPAKGPAWPWSARRLSVDWSTGCSTGSTATQPTWPAGSALAVWPGCSSRPPCWSATIQDPGIWPPPSARPPLPSTGVSTSPPTGRCAEPGTGPRPPGGCTARSAAPTASNRTAGPPTTPPSSPTSPPTRSWPRPSTCSRPKPPGHRPDDHVPALDRFARVGGRQGHPASSSVLGRCRATRWWPPPGGLLGRIVDRWLLRGRRGRRVVIGSRLRAAAAERVHRRFELQEVLVRGRLALVGIDQLTGGLDKSGDALVAGRILLGHDTSLADPRTPPAVVPDERPNHAG